MSETYAMVLSTNPNRRNIVVGETEQTVAYVEFDRELDTLVLCETGTDHYEESLLCEVSSFEEGLTIWNRSNGIWES